MAWVKVPPQHHPVFHAALPNDPRVETKPMFGGIAAKVNGHVFAGLFGRSAMIWLPEPDRAEALALPGAAPFDPMGDGRATSQKVMLPERMMANPAGASPLDRAGVRGRRATASQGEVARPQAPSEHAPGRTGGDRENEPRGAAVRQLAAWKAPRHANRELCRRPASGRVSRYAP
jgi:hypothetical protein